MTMKKSEIVRQAKGLHASTNIRAGANIFGCRKVNGKMVKKPVIVCWNGDCKTTYESCRYNGLFWS